MSTRVIQLVVSLCLLLGLGCTAASADGLQWSAPIAIEPAGSPSTVGQTAISCPTTTQCTSVDAEGQETTFNPSTPAAAAAGAASSSIDAQVPLTAISCASATACVAVGSDRDAIAFDPQQPLSASRAQLEGSYTLESVACTSATQCTAVDSHGDALTFDPTALATAPVVTQMGANLGFASVSCPSATQCTAVASNTGTEVTFNPQAPANGSTTETEAVNGGSGLISVACPSTGECVAADGNGDVLSFVPTTGASLASSTFVANSISAISCGSTSVCAAGLATGAPVAFLATSPAEKVPLSVSGWTNGAAGISCAAATSCTAVGTGSGEVTFNPGSLLPGLTQTLTTGSVSADAVACPGQTECVAAVHSGGYVVFDPTGVAAPGAVQPLSGEGQPVGIACPSTTECVVLDGSGRYYTFDPTNPSATVKMGRASAFGSPLAFSCPSTTQCDGIESTGYLDTFDPSTGVNGTQRTLIDGNASAYPELISCPSVTACVVVDQQGGEVEVDPSNPPSTAPTPNVLTDTSLTTPPNDHVTPASARFVLSCSSSTQCTLQAADASSTFRVVTFDPATGLIGSNQDTNSYSASATTCISATTCVMVGQNYALVADPTNLSGVAATHRQVTLEAFGGPYLSDVACSPAGLCVAVTGAGGAISFPVGVSASATAATVDSPVATTGAACPSATECVTVGADGRMSAFNPSSPGTPTTTQIASAGLDAVSCTGPSTCVAVGASGGEVTFNPANPGSRSSTQIDGTHTLEAVSCVAGGTCTAVDDAGKALTFSPASAGSVTPDTLTNVALSAVSCIAGGACVVGDGVGNVFVFTPPSGSAAEIAVGASKFGGISCPSAQECLAVDDSGVAYKIDPATDTTDPGHIFTPTLGSAGAVACPSVADCVVVGQLGVQAQYYPLTATSSTPVVVPGGGPFDAVACTSETQCVAVDQVGKAFVSSGAPPAPVLISAPTITGTTTAGQTLTAAHGVWGNSPSSYTDQWLRCSAQGSSCTAIAGATSLTYVLTAADVGSTLEIQETATNAGGTSLATLSAITGTVSAAPPTGVSSGGGSGAGAAAGNGSGRDGSGGSGSTSAGGVTVAAELAALSKNLHTPTRPAVCATITKAGHCGYAVSMPVAGTLLITWRTTGARPVEVAAGHVSLAPSRSAVVTIRLTGAGKRLLKGGRRLTLQATGAFKAQSGKSIHASVRFTWSA